MGNVHFVSINTETDWAGAEEENTGDGHFAFLPAGHFAPNGTYFNWLRQDLMAAAKSSRWILAGGHRPFEDFNHTQLGALFKAAGVAMYFAGHGSVDTGSAHCFVDTRVLINVNITYVALACAVYCAMLLYMGADTPTADTTVRASLPRCAYPLDLCAYAPSIYVHYLPRIHMYVVCSLGVGRRCRPHHGRGRRVRPLLCLLLLVYIKLILSRV